MQFTKLDKKTTYISDKFKLRLKDDNTIEISCNNHDIVDNKLVIEPKVTSILIKINKN